jgi:hypothetical protein
MIPLSSERCTFTHKKAWKITNIEIANLDIYRFIGLFYVWNGYFSPTDVLWNLFRLTDECFSRWVITIGFRPNDLAFIEACFRAFFSRIRLTEIQRKSKLFQTSAVLGIFIVCSVSLFLCLFVSLSLFCSVSLFLFYSVSLSLCFFVSMPLCLYASLSLSFFVSMPLCLYSFLSLCLFVSMPLCLYASLSLCLFVSIPLCLYASLSLSW